MKHFSPHLKNSGTMAAHKPDGKPEPKGPTGVKSKPADTAVDPQAKSQDMPHSSDTHGTQPHPATGVHAVHIHHMGGGHYQTHTHRDGGAIDTQDHMSADEAHQHAQSALPSEMAEQEPDGDEMPMMAGMSALGGDNDGDEA